MCLIIDTNVIKKVVNALEDSNYGPIWKALRDRSAVAHWGGGLRDEYFTMKRLRKLFLELDRQGVLRLADEVKVNEMSERVVNDGKCKSDDPHIIALAIVSGARLLCSEDRTLHVDFCNPKLLRPRGSVYQNVSHKQLIKKHCSKG